MYTIGHNKLEFFTLDSRFSLYRKNMFYYCLLCYLWYWFLWCHCRFSACMYCFVYIINLLDITFVHFVSLRCWPPLKYVFVFALTYRINWDWMLKNHLWYIFITSHCPAYIHNSIRTEFYRRDENLFILYAASKRKRAKKYIIKNCFNIPT